MCLDHEMKVTVGLPLKLHYGLSSWKRIQIKFTTKKRVLVLSKMWRTNITDLNLRDQNDCKATLHQKIDATKWKQTSIYTLLYNQSIRKRNCPLLSGETPVYQFKETGAKKVWLNIHWSKTTECQSLKWMLHYSYTNNTRAASADFIVFIDSNGFLSFRWQNELPFSVAGHFRNEVRY